MRACSASDPGVTKLLHDPRWSLSEIDWQCIETPKDAAPGLRWLAAHLLAGERLSESICVRLIDVSRDPLALAGLARQLADERRHQAAFARYLDMLGGAPEVADAFRPAFEAVAAWRGAPAALLIAGHVLLEGDAVDAAVPLRHMPCRLLARIYRLVAQDEARHVAFGRVLLAAELRHLDRVARLEIYAWARRAWMESAALTLRRFAGLAWLDRAGAEALWRRHHRRLVSIGLLA